MPNDRVGLRFSPKGSWAAVRELRGADESALSGTDTVAAIELADRLLERAPGTEVGPGDAASLTASDRDRVLAATYMRAYGRTIRATVTCEACGRPFDVDFGLDGLMATFDARSTEGAWREGTDGVFTLTGSLRFRLPTGNDECAVVGMAPRLAVRELGSRCMVQGDPETDLERCQEAMESVAPVVHVDLNAACPECGAIQTLRFDLQGYLLKTIMAGQRRLAAEVHALATAYGWPLNEILQLPRSQRRLYVDLAEGSAGSGSWR